MVRKIALNKFSIFTLILGLGITAISFIYVSKTLDERNEVKFGVLAKDVSDQLTHAVNITTYGLGGANGVFAASQSVEYSEYKSYVESRDLNREFPGVWGFGFIERVKRQDLAEFVARTRGDQQPYFSVNSSGDSPELYIMKFLMPEKENYEAIGFDISTDLNRKSAADLAMVTGLPTLTRKITLLQDSKHGAGFLYLRPVFKNGARIETEEDRRSALIGWVCAPFTLEKVLEPLLAKYGNLLTISVYDGDALQDSLLSYGAKPLRGTMSREVNLQVGQRPWTLVMQPKGEFFVQNNSRYIPYAVGIIGLLFSILIASVTQAYVNSRERAYNARLKEGEEFIQGILDSAGLAILVTETNGIIRVFNKAAEKMLGYQAEEVIGKETPAIIHDVSEIEREARNISEKLGIKVTPDFEVFIAECRHNLSSEKEWTYIRKDGSRFDVELAVTAMRDDKGDIVAYMGIANDITERKKAQIKLKQKTDELLLATKAGQIGIWRWEIGTDKVQWDKAMSDIYGVVHDDSADHLTIWKNSLYLDDIQKVNQQLQDCIQGVQAFDTEFRVIRPDRSLRYIQANAEMIPDHSGTKHYMVGTNIDVTIHREIESALEHAKVLAEQATIAKSQFLANMSHEIRTPLTSIIGYSESLMSDKLSKMEQQSALAIVKRNGEHLMGVINDILDYSKIEAGRLEVELMPVDLTELLSDVANLMQHKANEKGLSLGFEYLFPIPRSIITDPTRLKQILINLVGNAVKFTSTGGVKINISYTESEQRIDFAVIDTGLGLNAEQQSRLFQAFSQADTSITRKFGGSGLGLLISHQLAQKLGGSISVDSQYGRGSCFTLSISTGAVQELTFTLSKEVSLQQMVKSDNIPQFSGKILIAEDGEDNRGLISLLLKKTGVDFAFVENGALAVEAASTGNFDLILMDIQMPIMDGYTAISKIRSSGNSIPIVALTANAMKADLERAKSAGCTDFLGKPFTRQEFFSTLGRILNSTQPLEEKKNNTENSAQKFQGILERIREIPEMRELIVSIIHKFPERVNEIARLIHSESFSEASMLAHSMRGTSANIGFVEIPDVLAKIEEITAGSSPSSALEYIEPLKQLIEDAQDIDHILIMENL